MLKKSTTRLAALFVALCMALTLAPFAVFAKEPAETPAEAGAEAATSEAAEDSGEEAAAEPTEDSGEEAAAEPAEDSGEEAAAEPTEDSGEEVTTDPAEESGEADTTESTEETTETVTQDPTEMAEAETDLATPACAVTIIVAEGEPGVTAMYIPQGEAVTDEALLAGVSAADENGEAVAVTVADADGLDRDNPQPKGEPGSPEAYIITYAAEGAEAVTRECFVTVAVVPLALPVDNANYSCESVGGINTLTIKTDAGTTAWRTDTSIGSSPDLAAASINSVVIMSGVTSIGMSAFRGCTALESVEIPDSVTEIGGLAFSNCTALRDITFKKNSPPNMAASTVFINVPSSVVAHVPDGMGWIYEAALKKADFLGTVVAPTYTISATPDALDFGSPVSPYVPPAVQTVTVTNTGTGAVTLDQPISTNYIIGALSPDRALDAANDTATFTVQPRAGLAVGTYNETIDITGSDGTSASVNLTFEVTAAKPNVTFTVQGSGINLAKPTDLVFAADNGLLDSAAFSAVQFMRLSDNQTSTVINNGQYGLIFGWAGGRLTIPAAVFGQHSSGSPLMAGNYRAIITFTLGGGDFQYEADFSMTNIPDTYLLTVNGGTGDGSYEAGDRVTIIAAAAPGGQRFKEWRVDSGNPFFANVKAETTTFDMPANNVEVTAAYEPIPGPKPEPKPSRTSSGHDDNDNDSDSESAYNPPAADDWLDPVEARPLAASSKRLNLDYIRTFRTGRYGVRGKAWAELSGLKFYHETILGGVVQVRTYFDDPGLFTKDARVSGYLAGPNVTGTRALFEKWFSNKIRVIHFDQPGRWEQPIKIAARVDLAGMDTARLVFYSYDSKSNRYRKLKAPAYRIDANGYLRFRTGYAGEIVIAEGKLEKRKWQPQDNFDMLPPPQEISIYDIIKENNLGDKSTDTNRKYTNRKYTNRKYANGKYTNKEALY